MMKKTYNKLIRDKIPEIILSSGEKPKVKILGNRQYKEELKKKLIEEVRELNLARGKKEIINELADISELIDWICREYKVEKDILKKCKTEKNSKRGSFKDKLFLVETN